MTARTPGLRGRLPVKPPAERFAIGYLSDYLREPLPAPVYPIDVTGGIGPDAWGLLGNGPDPTCTTHPNGVGDCAFCGEVHYRMAKAASYKETEQFPDSDAVVAAYLTYDHGQDVGVNLADMLLHLYRSRKILAFAPVDHTSPAAVDSAMEAFKGVLVGVDLTDDANDLFSAGKPWTVANGQQPDPSEGHAIVKVRSDGHMLDGYVTWGALQEATTGWSRACLTECWALVSSEDEAAKIDMPALLADINALRGKGDPAPAAAPEVAHEGLLHDLRAKVRWAGDMTGRNYAEVLDWLRARRP